MFHADLLWQNDERWATTTLGFGPQTIREWGSLTTTLTMALNGCGYFETPVTFSQKMSSIGAFYGAAINVSRLNEAFPSVALKELVNCEETSIPLLRIDTTLAANHPVLVCVEQSPVVGILDHWVLLVAKEGDDYLMLDPWRYPGDEMGKLNYLTQRYKTKSDLPGKEITQVLFLQVLDIPDPALSAQRPSASDAPTAPMPIQLERIPLPIDSVTLQPILADVAFRGAPSLSAPLLKRFPLTATLHSLEPQDVTQLKLGAAGQWLNVETMDGDQGFVPAWMFKAVDSPVRKRPAREYELDDGDSTDMFVVKVLEDRLAFRSQPVIADRTIIERLSLGTLLVAIDPLAAEKVGVLNQWLKVLDSDGREGYVAAWLVSR